MKKIPTSKGKYVLVDDEDYDELSQYKWTDAKGYAFRWTGRPNRARIYMHRFLKSAGEGQLVDHVNGDTLDNRKENLRLCTYSQNNMNKSLQSNSTSGLKGAYYHKPSGKWRAQIRKDKTSIHLGYFGSATDAHEAYKAAATEMFGVFARYN